MRYVDTFLEVLFDGHWICEEDGVLVSVEPGIKDFMEDATQLDARIFRMKIFGLSYEEIALRTGKCEMTVRRHLNRAMSARPARLREDFYLPFFQRHLLSWDEFHQQLPAESQLTYNYLTYRTKGIEGRTKVNWEK